MFLLDLNESLSFTEESYYLISQFNYVMEQEFPQMNMIAVAQLMLRYNIIINYTRG